MSKYTTEVRFICEQASGLSESKGYNDTNSIIDLAIPKVFNFDFPIFDEKYRVVLERKIIKHFYTREIGEETVGLWKLRLDTRLNEIMPYYNKLYNSELLEFNPLYTANLTRTKKTDYDSNRNENENINDTTKNNGTTNSTNESSVNGTGSGTSSNNGTDLYSDTPQGSLTGVENETYLTNARKTTDSGTTTSTTTNTSNASGSITSTESNTYGRVRDNKDALTSTEDYLETVIGFEGTNASELLMKYRETFINIDVMILNELEDLFFQLW
jgi:hypothetical protein